MDALGISLGIIFILILYFVGKYNSENQIRRKYLSEIGSILDDVERIKERIKTLKSRSLNQKTKENLEQIRLKGKSKIEKVAKKMLLESADVNKKNEYKKSDELYKLKEELKIIEETLDEIEYKIKNNDEDYDIKNDKEASQDLLDNLKKDYNNKKYNEIVDFYIKASGFEERMSNNQHTEYLLLVISSAYKVEHKKIFDSKIIVLIVRTLWYKNKNDFNKLSKYFKYLKKQKGISKIFKERLRFIEKSLEEKGINVKLDDEEFVNIFLKE